MKLKEVYNAADELAPFALSKEYIERLGYYDNSGILLDCGEEIEGVLFSLDLSLAAVEEAKKRGANLIFTHHPAIWDGVKRLTREETPALFACIKEGISVISAHLNLDAAPEGIDESLMRGLGGSAPIAVMEELALGGYGRVYDVPPKTAKAFSEGAKREFQTERVVFYGDHAVKRVASFCGGGFEGKSLSFALRMGADTVVSSDGKHHLIVEAVEKGLNVLLFTHYASEIYGFRKFYARMKERIPAPCVFFEDERLL